MYTFTSSLSLHLLSLSFVFSDVLNIKRFQSTNCKHRLFLALDITNLTFDHDFRFVSPKFCWIIGSSTSTC